ncbi:hypothetical protein GF323_07170 [Candidatus Woesearchaeota archaeon]|nr:hypothetical protein [Candidatus Woesearchaeota archaeon]
MGKKKAPGRTSRNAFLARISRHEKIGELADIFKELLKQEFNVRYQYTFEEIREIIRRKRIDDKIKFRIIELAESFEKLEYRPGKPGRKALNKLKKSLRQIARNCLKNNKQKKQFSIQLGIKKKVEKAKRSIEKKEIRKRKIEDKVKKQIKKAPVEFDSECREIARYVNASMGAGIKSGEIRRELREMGFRKEKIEFVLKQKN